MITLSAPDISPLELTYVSDAVASTFISSAGPYVDRFEAAWATRCAVSHAVTVANGTAALTLVMQALGAGRGDEVVIPAFTFAAVAGAVAATGATPVCVDVDADTWCIDPGAARAAITSRTVGLVAVHGYGHPAPMARLGDIARRHDLWLVEDGAEAHLAEVDGRPVGGLADAAAFSFFANKVLAAGEGGAVTTNDPAIAAAVRSLANHGVAPGAPDRYRPVRHGTNQRLSNVACALLTAQLERVEELLARRRAVEARYHDGIDLRWPRPAPGVTTVPWLVTGVVPDGADRDAVVTALATAGVEARRTFPAIPDLVPYRSDADVPVARRLAATGISLPTHPGLSDADVDAVIAAARAAVGCQPTATSVR